jgi:hypothetical protein
MVNDDGRAMFAYWIAASAGRAALRRAARDMTNGALRRAAALSPCWTPA